GLNIGGLIGERNRCPGNHRTRGIRNCSVYFAAAALSQNGKTKQHAQQKRRQGRFLCEQHSSSKPSAPRSRFPADLMRCAANDLYQSLSNEFKIINICSTS